MVVAPGLAVAWSRTGSGLPDADGRRGGDADRHPTVRPLDAGGVARDLTVY